MTEQNTPSLVPIPDPTALTTDQLRREMTTLKELFDVRLNAIDKAQELLHENSSRVPSENDKSVTHVRELVEERFRSIQKQFDERDIRSQASEDAAKVAVNAALQAQKEAAAAQNDANAAAITKSEAATVKQIDGILALLASNTKAIDEKITSINSRLDRGDGGITGKSTQQATIIAVGGFILALILGGFTMFNRTPGPVYVQPPQIQPR